MQLDVRWHCFDSKSRVVIRVGSKRRWWNVEVEVKVEVNVDGIDDLIFLVLMTMKGLIAIAIYYDVGC